MNVLLTVVLMTGLGLWALAVSRRLARLRAEVKLAWQRLEVDRSNEAVKAVYNKHVAAYNNALEEFPANVVAGFAGFKPAKSF